MVDLVVDVKAEQQLEVLVVLVVVEEMHLGVQQVDQEIHRQQLQLKGLMVDLQQVLIIEQEVVVEQL